MSFNRPHVESVDFWRMLQKKIDCFAWANMSWATVGELFVNVVKIIASLTDLYRNYYWWTLWPILSKSKQTRQRHFCPPMKREMRTDIAGKAPAHIKSCESLTSPAKKWTKKKRLAHLLMDHSIWYIDQMRWFFGKCRRGDDVKRRQSADF